MWLQKELTAFLQRSFRDRDEALQAVGLRE